MSKSSRKQKKSDKKETQTTFHRQVMRCELLLNRVTRPLKQWKASTGIGRKWTVTEIT